MMSFGVTFDMHSESICYT